MRTNNVRYRVPLIVAVVMLSAWSFHPPDEKISLGLDLKGGLHLVLRVDTDDALRVESQKAAERLRDALARSGVVAASVEPTGPAELVVEGVDDEAALRTAAADLETSFDRTAGGRVHTFRMRPAIVDQIREDTVGQAIRIIERRVNELGVTEPVVARYGRNDQILVHLPAVREVERAKQIIRATAQVRLTLVEQGPFPGPEAAVSAYGGALPDHLELLPGRTEGTAETVYHVVRKTAVVAGNDLRSAQQSRDEFNRPAVAFSLQPEAARRFGDFTQQHINRIMATVLDDRVVSVATIVSRIDDRGQIVGITREQMIDQVITLNSGALPADLHYLEQHVVSATLGQASIRAGVLASVAGLALVALFMLAYYRLTGLNALVSIVLNLVILLGLMAFIGAALTLPGIAGLVLTVGMGVDSNVLIFERIKEELPAARGARAAVKAGFDRVWITIVDTHVASLIAAAFLFQFGTSPIRGFATTLTLGLMANVFTAVFVSRTLFELTLRRRRGDPQSLSI